MAVRLLPTRSQLDAFLAPTSVAVVGASDDPSRPGGRAFSYLMNSGFAGSLHPVNPKHADVGGLAAVATPADLAIAPDLVVVAVPAEHVPDIVRSAGERGARAAVVFANGFAESGDETLNNALRGAVADTGIRLLGPNCLGLVVPELGVAATFASFLKSHELRPGGVALLTQSGAVGNGILLGLEGYGVGVRAWVSTGNELDVDLLDFAEYFVDDASTTTVVCFAEALRGGERISRIAAAMAEASKLFVVLKAGTAQRSRTLAASHSGKLLGSHQLWSQIADMSGVIRPRTLEELIDVSHCATAQPAACGDLAVLCSSGGLGVLIADACEREGVALAALTSSTTDALRTILPPSATFANPVDPTGAGEDAYFEALLPLVEDDATSTVLVIVNSLSRDYDTVVGRLAPIARRARDLHKTLAVSYFCDADRLPAAQETDLRTMGCVVIADPARFIAAIGRLRVTSSNECLAVHVDDEQAFSGVLSWMQATSILEGRDVPLAPTVVVPSADEAVDLLTRWPLPMVLKVDDPAIPHKSDVGGVRLGLMNEAEVRRAFSDLNSIAGSDAGRVLAQQQAQKGIEVLVGCRRDPELGPVVSVGPGGVLAELVADIVSHPCPAPTDDLHRILSGSRLMRLLGGYRGEKPSDIDAFVACVSAISQVFADHDELIELEINPMLVHENGRGCTVVDVLARRGEDLP